MKKLVKKLVAFAVITTCLTASFVFANQGTNQEASQEAEAEECYRRLCGGGGVCCPVSSCSNILPVLSLAGSFNYTITGNGDPVLSTTIVTQGACFTVTGVIDMTGTLVFTVSFLRPFSIAPVVLAQRLSGTPVAITSVTGIGFTVTTSPTTGPSTDTISFIAQQACV